jgi:uncharacterized membrane protein YbhN (UPF0104 family)
MDRLSPHPRRDATRTNAKRWHASWIHNVERFHPDPAELLDERMSALSLGTLSSYRSSKRAWFALVSMLAIAALLLILFDATIRTSALETWQRMAAMQPRMLALIVLLKIGQAIFSAMIWRNILCAAYPKEDISYKFVLGVDQGQDAINAIAPAKAGTWALLSAFRFSIPGARMPTMLGVWAVQSIGFFVFAVINMIVLAITVPGAVGDRPSIFSAVTNFFANRPFVAWPALLIMALIAVVAVFRLRPAISRTRKQLALGGAILGSPRRYLLIVFLPTAMNMVFRCAVSIALLSSFDIPVTPATVSLSLASQSVAGAVKVTPGGLGTTQAINVVAFQAFASAEAVTAYSLTETALTAIISLLIGIVALFWAFGWTRSRTMLSRRSQLMADFQRRVAREKRISDSNLG